ncbi:MAG: hypothetical protein IKS55_02905, partial [Oscillospiraceae bacterium]|nr:hypothetical protein [Oscillospiraceae bacterium]
MDDEGLAAVHIAGREDMRHAGTEAAGFRFDGAVPLDAEGLADIGPAAGKAGRADQELTGAATIVAGADYSMPTAANWRELN